MDQSKLSQLADLLKEYHNEDLKKEQMVTQIWCDGEITLQKGGDLFGLRTLHMAQPAIFRNTTVLMKHVNFPDRAGQNGYAIVTYEHAQELRKMMLQLYEKE